MLQPLSEMLLEPLESVRHRERHTLEDLLSSRGSRVVLFGAGNLGRRAAAALKGIGIAPLAFSDNDPSRWRAQIDGVRVLEPAEAASRYGADSTFLVTIWNEFHWFPETEQQLSSLGCRQVIPYTYLHWRFPDVFLPCLLNDLPCFVYEDRSRVLAAENIWADERSRDLYRANVQLRTLGTLDGLPGRPAENTYLPQDILELSETEHFLDCGATNGEMIKELLLRRGDRFAAFHALEADRISFQRLEEYHRQLPDGIRHKVKLHNVAVGKERALVQFSNTGGTGSKIAQEGMTVECVPIDELFGNATLTFLKMDIEGAEFESLLGARKVIVREQPILAICVYHTQNDLWCIPLLALDMLPNHSLFLRAYEGDGFQTVLFAVPKDKLRLSYSGPAMEANSAPK